MTTNARRFCATMLAALAISAQQTASAYADAHNEDDPSWSCVDDGNRICGPDNPEGKPAGCYDIGGVLVQAWPCEPVPSGTFADPDEAVYLIGYTN